MFFIGEDIPFGVILKAIAKPILSVDRFCWVLMG